MRWLLFGTKVVLGLVLVFTLEGCGTQCHKRSCGDFSPLLTLEVRAPDGGPVDRFRGAITLDGQSNAFACPASLDVSQQYRCEDAGTVQVSLSWIGRSGTSRVSGPPPTMLPLSVESEDGGLTWSRTLTPAYGGETFGAGTCALTCYSHRETVILEKP